MTPKAKGEIVEAIVLAELLKLGKAVSIPFGNNQPYDFIVDEDGKLSRIQVKTGRHFNGSLMFDICSRNTITGKRTKYIGRADEFMVFAPPSKKIYRVPVHECGISSKTLRLEPVSSKYQGSKHFKWARDYEMKLADTDPTESDNAE